jgi:tetrahydromethanopterin S-methyltransferase subunit B
MNRRDFLKLQAQIVGFTGTILITASCSTTKSGSQPAAVGDDSVMIDIDKVNERRSMAEYYIQDLTRQFETSPALLTSWKEEYIAAQSAVNLWIGSIQQALRDGKDPTLTASYNYRNRYENAVKKSEAFLESSRKLANAGPPKSPEMIALAFSLGSMLWNKYKNYQQAEREQKAKELDQYYWRSIPSILKDA